jgi:HD-like signal output (HDOD) protein
MAQANAAADRRPVELARIPVLPAARAGALSMLQDENVHLGDLAGVIAADPGLTLVLLRAANSAQSASRRHIDHARDAMIRVGLMATKRMVAAAVVGGAFVDLGECGIDVEAFWAHSLAVAVIAESGVPAKSRPAAFSAGLLHDIGRLALAASVPRSYPAISDRATNEGMILAAERAIFGEDHAAAGGRILAQWGVPAEITDAVTLHHAGRAGDLHEGLRKARSVADALGYHDGVARSFEMPLVQSPDPAAASALHARVEWYRSALRGSGE